jgi:MraZ protein
VFLGVSTVSLDAKGRLAVPARYRQRLEECCSAQLVVTINPRERCLWMYPEPEWREIAQKLSRLPTLKPQNQLMQRLILGHALEVEMDGQGRILLSTQLRDYAALDKLVAVVVQGHNFEIWDEAHWNEQRLDWLAAAAETGSARSAELEELAL